MSLRAKVQAGELLVGTFIKTPAPHNIEVLAYAGLDFAMADQEHAPLDLGAMDQLALAARASGMPLLARCWGQEPARISPLMDLGCAGVMVPHVTDAGVAEPWFPRSSSRAVRAACRPRRVRDNMAR